MPQLNLPILHHLQCIIKVGRKYILNSNQKQIKKRQIQRLNFGGDGGIRTHVPVPRQTHFECVPLRPLRYVSMEHLILKGSVVDTLEFIKISCCKILTSDEL